MNTLSKGAEWMISLLGNPQSACNPESRKAFLEYVNNLLVNNVQISEVDMEELYRQKGLPEEQKSEFVNTWFSYYEIIRDYVNHYSEKQ